MRVNETKKQKKLTPHQALVKIQSYCAYQERSHYEVKEKLYQFGLYSKDIDQIMASLIIDNFLNEERFAESYTNGKLRIKKWGRHKIKTGLIAKKTSEYCIKKALREIDEEEYLNILQQVIQKRARIEKEKNSIIRNSKIAKYVISRGFEQDLVWDILKKNSVND